MRTKLFLPLWTCLLILALTTRSYPQHAEDLLQIEASLHKNENKAVLLSTELNRLNSQIQTQSESIKEKNSSLFSRMYALNNIQKKGWGGLLGSENLKTARRNFYLFAEINKRDINLIKSLNLSHRELSRQKTVLEKKQELLKNLTGSLNTQKIQIQAIEDSNIQSLQMAKSKSLLLSKGQLPLPVNSAISEAYGRKQDDLNQFYYFSPGLTFMSEPLSEVFAIASGQVVFADNIDYWGTTVIIEHDGGYYSVYTELTGVKVAIGNFTEQKSILGYTTGSQFYFELRHNSVSIDTKNWFQIDKKGQL